MAIRKHITDEQERAFEAELLSVLRRDKDHRFNFDGKLKVFSNRYGCMLQAVDVHWDERERNLVFVGAVRGGQPVFDYSRGYPQIQHELSIPFRECFEDLRKMDNFNELYLLSKTRKAVLDKCIASEMSLTKAYPVTRNGRLVMEDFSDRDCMVLNGSTPVGSVSLRDGVLELQSKEGVPISIKDLSFGDIQRIGAAVGTINGKLREARKAYTEARGRFVPDNGTLDESADRKGAAEGLSSMFERGFPLRVCHGVAAALSTHYANTFDDLKHSEKDIVSMIRAYRTMQKPFGFNDQLKDVKRIIHL